MELRELKHFSEADFIFGLAEWFNDDASWFTFDWKPGLSHEAHIQRLENNKLGVDLPQGFVASTMLYAKWQGTLIGRVHIRHELNRALKKRGGHLGYCVAPRFRNRGLGKKMIELALPVCRQLGQEQLLITCSQNNKASINIIESFGGQKVSESFDQGEDPIFRFQLKLSAI